MTKIPIGPVPYGNRLAIEIIEEVIKKPQKTVFEYGQLRRQPAKV